MPYNDDKDLLQPQPTPMPMPMPTASPMPTPQPGLPVESAPAPIDIPAPIPAPMPTAAPSLQMPRTATVEQTTTHQEQYRPQDETRLNKAVDAEINAARANADLEAAQADAAAKEHTLKSAQYQKAIEEDQRVEQERQNQLQTARDGINQQIQAYQSQKIDPSRLFGNMSTGDRVVAGLAVALGSLGSAWAGGPNVAIEAIDKAIARDIDAQKANMDKAGRNIDVARTMYQDLRQKFGDDRIAREATREQIFNQLAADAQARAAAAKSPLIKSQAEQAITALQTKAAEAQLNRNKLIEEKVSKDVPLNGGPGGKVERVLENAERTDLTSKANVVNSLVEFDKMLDNPTVVKNMGPVDNYITQLQTKFGVGSVPDDVIKASQQGNLIAKAYLRAMSGAGVTDKEFQRTTQDVLATLSMKPEAARARIRNMAEAEMKDWDTTAKGIVSNTQDDPRAQAIIMRMRPNLHWQTRAKYENKK